MPFPTASALPALLSLAIGAALALIASPTHAQAAAAAQRAEHGHDPQPLLVVLMRAGVIIAATE